MATYTPSQILEAVKTAAQLCGCDLSDEVAKVMVMEMRPYGGEAVMQMLHKLRRTHKGRFSLAQMIELIEQQDGRPGVEEAWGVVAMLLTDETRSAVLTAEMRQAYYASAEVFNASGDMVGARMTFKEVYSHGLIDARNSGTVAEWKLSQGSDKQHAAQVIRLAYEQGKLSQNAALNYLPTCADDERHFVETGKVLTLEDKRKAAERLEALAGKLNLRLVASR